MTACVLPARLKLPAPHGDPAEAEPETLRCRLLHAATWLWTGEITTALAARPGHPAPALTSGTHPGDQERTPRGPRGPTVARLNSRATVISRPSG